MAMRCAGLMALCHGNALPYLQHNYNICYAFNNMRHRISTTCDLFMLSWCERNICSHSSPCLAKLASVELTF